MIAYTPVDIKCRLPNYQTMIDYIESNYITNLDTTLGYTSKLCALAAHYPISDWRDACDIFRNHGTGYILENEHNLYFAPEVTKLFPELFEIIFNLPYQQIYGLGLSLHTAVLPAHRDEIDLTGAVSPERYNVLVSPHYEQPSFFVSKDNNGIEKYYPTILEEYPIYAFANKDIYHGADIVLDRRIILICDGILDQDKHQALIKRSTSKFSQYVIRIES